MRASSAAVIAAWVAVSPCNESSSCSCVHLRATCPVVGAPDPSGTRPRRRRNRASVGVRGGSYRARRSPLTTVTVAVRSSGSDDLAPDSNKRGCTALPARDDLQALLAKEQRARRAARLQQHRVTAAVVCHVRSSERPALESAARARCSASSRAADVHRAARSSQRSVMVSFSQSPMAVARADGRTGPPLGSNVTYFPLAIERSAT